MRVESVLDLIGSTPMVGIHKLSPNPDVKMYLKLEGYNPGGSIKDRVALSLIKDAKEKGLLKPNCTVIESSSGNTGIGLSLVCKLFGYKLVVVVPENVTIERINLLRSFGAEIIFSPANQGSNGAITYAKKLASEHPDWVYLYQYGNFANPIAHEQATALEILSDCPELDVVVGGLGTSGTLMGISKFMKKNKPGVKIVAVEPPAGELVSGLRSLEDGFIPEIFDEKMIDRRIMIRSDKSVEITRKLLDLCGLFVGVSTGAIVAGAIKHAQGMQAGTMVVISPDSGWKYLSGGIWTDEIEDVLTKSQEVNYW